MSNHKDTLRAVYPKDLIRSGERGQYTDAYGKGTNVVLIEPDLYGQFPDSEAVNRALRDYLASQRTAT